MYDIQILCLFAASSPPLLKDLKRNESNCESVNATTYPESPIYSAKSRCFTQETTSSFIIYQYVAPHDHHVLDTSNETENVGYKDLNSELSRDFWLTLCF